MLIYVQISAQHGPCCVFLSVNSDQGGATISDNLLGGNLINSSNCLSVSIHLHVASGTNNGAVSIPIHSSLILMLSCPAEAAVDEKSYVWMCSVHGAGLLAFPIFFSCRTVKKRHLCNAEHQTKRNIANYMT